MVQASHPAQAQAALAAVEVGSPEVGDLSGEEGVDGDEGDHEAVAGVVEAVQHVGTHFVAHLVGLPACASQQSPELALPASGTQ